MGPRTRRADGILSRAALSDIAGEVAASAVPAEARGGRAFSPWTARAGARAFAGETPPDAQLVQLELDN